MTTVINTPPGNTEDSGSNLVAVLILVVVIIAVAVLFFVYGLPMIQNSQNPNGGTTNINVTTPTVPTTPTTPVTPTK
jgi:hypothetical protein